MSILSTVQFRGQMYAPEETIKHLCNIIREQCLDVKVKLVKGKYKGREGYITEVIPDKVHGLRYLIMVMRDDVVGVLNSDAESRMYRPKEDFEIL